MDYAEFWATYDAGEWEPYTRDWVKAKLKPGDVFVDVGAWIGPVSLWALSAGAYVIAIEPDPTAVVELRSVLGPSVFACRAEVHEVAIVAVPGEKARLAPCPRPGSEWGDSMSGIAPELATSRLVESRTLPEILDGRVPRVVKIDVEGYEERLAPALLPWLAERGCSVQVSIHGAQLSRSIGKWRSATFLPDVRWGDWRLDA